MLKRDFIMVQIEEISKMIVQLVYDRNDGNDGAKPQDTQKAQDLIDTIYRTLKTNIEFILSHSPQEIREELNHDDSCGLERMELAAKTMIEQSYYNIKDSDKLRRKACEIIEYVQANDSTFSLERMQILNEYESVSK